MIDFPYKKLVIWGLKTGFHTHRYIHKHFHENAKKLSIPCVWTNDRVSEAGHVETGDLVIAVNVAGRNLPVRQGVDYCLHNFHELQDIEDRIDPARCIRLTVYTKAVEQRGEKWDSSTIFNRRDRRLYQAWGTDLLAHEFKKPTFSTLPLVIWVGSVWNNKENQGNIEQIAEFRKVLARRRLRYIHIQLVPNAVNVAAIRISRIAPAIAGAWQVEHDYLPCRMFKNISYGQLGFTNVRKFKDIYRDTFIESSSISELVDKALEIGNKQYLEMTYAQQTITKNHTYERKLANIIRALQEIK